MAIVAAAFFFLLITLPRTSTVTWTGDPALARRTLAGAFHIHSTTSDGSGDRAAIAAAAARAGLQFVILTDHGDGTAAPRPPAYLDGVLCLDGVEISTAGGHYVALGMPEAPYPLGGEPDAVVEDVARLGGFGIAAHPDSAKTELAWRGWDTPIDGLEWLNADSEWRNESKPRLLIGMARYLMRPGAALASLLDRPAATLERWDALTARRPVVAVAGHDAHGGGRRAEDANRRGVPGVPSYDASFRSFSVRAILDAPPTGDAAADGGRLLDAIRRGRVFTAIDAVAAPAVIDFQASGSSGGSMGDVLAPGAATLTVRATVPAGGHIVLLRNGTEVARTIEPFLSVDAPDAAGAYRVEVTAPSAAGNPPVPWLLGNPIYFLAPRPQPAAVTAWAPTPVPEGGWRIEHDPGSTGSVIGGAGESGMSFQLKGDARASQFVALTLDLDSRTPRFARLDFDVRGSRPMRVSAQLRYPAVGGVRWARSFYVPTALEHVSVAVPSMVPADRQSGPPPQAALPGSLLLVVDLTNARPGDSGRLWVSNLRVGP